ncbi:MAG: ankyrin repeat domain-containing protein [Pyrinomonadaceae bacterium]
MSEMELIEAVKAGDREAAKGFIESGAEVNRQDKQGWTALNWAAARGDLGMIDLLLQHGADHTEVGRDLRTPSMIALAAGQAEAVKRLRRADAERKGEGGAQSERQYCAAYHVGELRGYPGWAENKNGGGEVQAESNGSHGGLPDNEVVFIHQDYSVTKSILPDEDVIFGDVTEEWKEYCRTRLGFSVIDDLDLMGRPAEAPPSAA